MEVFYILDALLQCFPEPVRWLIGVVLAIALVTALFKLFGLIMDALPVL